MSKKTKQPGEWICCDQDLRSPFCPQCGKKQDVPSLSSLIAYLSSQASMHLKRAKNQSEMAKKLRLAKIEKRAIQREKLSETNFRKASEYQAWLDIVSARTV